MRLISRLIGAVVVFVLLVGVGLFFVPGEKIAQLAADELSRRTGREVVVTGEARLSIWPELGVTVGGLRIANADWSENGPLFQAQSVTIGVDAAALFKRDIRIRALNAEAPEILLERNKDGRGNWDISPSVATKTATPTAETPTKKTSAPLAFTLDRAVITNASVFYADQVTGAQFSQRGIDLTLTYPEVTGPADIDLTLRPQADPIRLQGTVSDPQGLIAAKVSPLDLKITTPGGTASFKGRASTQPEAQGKLSVDLSETAAVFRALGLAPPNLPAGLGRNATLTGDMTFTQDGALALRNTTVTSGPNRATVALDLSTAGARPQIKAQINASALDLTSLTGSGGGKSTPAPAGTGWSTTPIDASALGLINGSIALTAPSVALGTTTLGATNVLVAIDNSRAVTTLKGVEAFGGTLTGEFVANNRKGLSVGGTLNADGIALKQMLSELAGITRFTGDAAARIKFLGAGQSTAAIMNSLSGEGGINTGRGTIEGIDLDRLFRGGDPTGGTTIFDATTATFTIKDGVLSNSDLLMKLAGIEARGDGRIDLGKQQLDYLFTPVSLQARDGRGVAVPVRIRGPWSSPKITVDLEKAIQLNASEEKAKIEQKVRDKVAKELGVEQKEGESTEDALKRTLEEEAKKGLLKLLNR